MKKIVVVLLMLVSMGLTAQKSVLLRANYQKGDKYIVKVEQIQDLGLAASIQMNITMNMTINETTKAEIISESQITDIKMTMLQGDRMISYDSSQSEGELDDVGKGMKAQLDPMMKSIILTTMNRFGETLNTKIDPPNPAMGEYADQGTSMTFPKEKVSVGSSWEVNEDEKGMNMKIIYTVKEISNGMVYLDVSGTVSGMGEGKIQGKTEIEIATGIQKKSEIEVSVQAMGQQVKVTSKTNMTKV